MREKLPAGVTAQAPTANGVTYDFATYQVKAVVADNQQGKLDITWSLVDNPSSDQVDIAFKNSYQADATELSFAVLKRLEGAELQDGQFAFQMLDAAGNKVMESVNTASGQVWFALNDITEVGVFEYSIVEVNDAQEDVVYDDETLKLTVTVTDPGTGQLEAKVAFSDPAATFVNKYVDPDGSPKIPGGSGGKGLSQTGDGLMAIVVLAGVIAAAAVAVGVIAFRKARR